MRITFDVSGFYDWEPADKHPGVQVTEADARAMRAKKLANGGWHIRVERTLDTHHDVSIPELSLCMYVAQQAAYAGKDLTREEAACYFLRSSNAHHIARRHVRGVVVHDDGPNKALMEAVLAQLQLDPKVAEGALARYLEDVDMQASISAQFGPRPKKVA